MFSGTAIFTVLLPEDMKAMLPEPEEIAKRLRIFESEQIKILWKPFGKI